MRIYYQGNPGSYSHSASLKVAKNLRNISIEAFHWNVDFKSVWENLWNDNILVLPIENSYMWTIPGSGRWFLNNLGYKIIWNYDHAINHCLCSKEDDIVQITQAYSQMPALEQCHMYLKEKWIIPMTYSDTALSAKLASETEDSGIAAICSELAAELYGLNILERNIQDHKGNTTRFAIIAPKDLEIEYQVKTGKISLLFEAKHIPASLYKCLGAFATSGINLTKIESLPSYKWEFSAMFWVDIEGTINDENTKNALEELKNYTTEIRILGAY